MDPNPSMELRVLFSFNFSSMGIRVRFVYFCKDISFRLPDWAIAHFKNMHINMFSIVHLLSLTADTAKMSACLLRLYISRTSKVWNKNVLFCITYVRCKIECEFLTYLKISSENATYSMFDSKFVWKTLINNHDGVGFRRKARD